MRLFVNLATGPENPTRAALAFLVARTAAEEGHEVRLFLAGDAVQLVRPETAEAARGIGTGSVAEHWDALRTAGVRWRVRHVEQDAGRRRRQPAGCRARAAHQARRVGRVGREDARLLRRALLRGDDRPLDR